MFPNNQRPNKLHSLLAGLGLACLLVGTISIWARADDEGSTQAYDKTRAVRHSGSMKSLEDAAKQVPFSMPTAPDTNPAPVKDNTSAGSNLAATNLGAEAGQSSEFIFKKQVRMTLVPVRVLNHGKSVKGLRKEDFEVRENNRLQDVKAFDSGDGGFNLVIVIDVSKSMGPTGRLATAIPAAQHFIDVLKPEDRCAIVAFSTPRPGINLADLVQDFTSDKNALNYQLTRLHAQGETPLYDTLIAVISRKLSSLEGQKNAVVVLTDGGDNTSRSSFEQTIDYVQDAGIPIYSIDLDEFPNQNLRKISEVTGASYYKVKRLKDLGDRYQKIAEQLRDTYTLSYYSDSTDPRDWRSIQVKVRHSGQVIARKGYCPSAACQRQKDESSGLPK